MTYTRLPYEDAATTSEMSHDCQAAESNLPAHARATETHDSPLLASDHAPARGLEVSDSLAEMAAGLHLHFD